MPLPEGFKKISPWPWRHKAGSVDRVVSAIGDTICSDQSYSHVETDLDDQPIIASAPDHALLLAAISAGTARIFIFDGFVSIRVWANAGKAQAMPWGGQQFYATLDSFGCPVLTEECRAALIKALEATP